MGNSSRITEFFDLVIRLPAVERAALLQDCPAELRTHLIRLLDAYQDLGSMFATQSQHVSAPRATGPEIGQPETVGPYHIVRELASGGMGVVYLAEQSSPISRRVAVKLMRAGMHARGGIERFGMERQALAIMDHPCIAAVFDAGTTTDGRPYFAMEYVDGVSITKYCEQNSLGLRQRLELFTAVCGAVQHAHQKGVIHRDLKPSNILVCLKDGRPAPKVIDFGIAKAMESPLTERPLVTENGILIGTPEYMSPEQILGDARGVDSTTDIYSLGVVLYEMLVGDLPVSPARLRGAGMAGMVSIVRDEDPLPPSARLGSSRPGGKFRDVVSGLSIGVLKCDLDWIVMKAMDKDRARRYSSASELAADVLRHLADEPILARPPSLPYRMRKFVQRQRAFVSAAVLVVAVLLAGLVTSTALFVRADRARSEADRQRRRAEGSAYVANVNLAASSLGSFDVASARRYLKVTQPAMRGWEWRHLLYSADSSLAALQAYGPAPLTWQQPSFAFPDGGRKVMFQASEVVREWEMSSLRASGAHWLSRRAILALSEDGRFVIAQPVPQLSPLQVIEVATGREVVSVPVGHFACHAAFAANGSRIVTATDDGMIGVWDLPAGSMVASHRVNSPVRSLRISPDGKIVAFAGYSSLQDTTLHLLEPQTGRVRRLSIEANVFEFSADGAWLAVTSPDRRIRLWSLNSSAVSAVLDGHPSEVSAVAFHRNGRQLATAGSESVRIWDLRNGTAIATLPVDSNGSAPSATPGRPDVKDAYQVGRVRGAVRQPDALSFDPTGTRLLFARHRTDAASEIHGWMIKVWAPDRASAIQAQTIQGFPEHAKILVEGFSANGNALLLCEPVRGDLALWSIDTELLSRIGADRFISCRAARPVLDDVGRHVAAAIGQTARVWDVRTGRALGLAVQHAAPVNSLAFSPQGAQLASSSGDGRIVVSDRASGRRLASLSLPGAPSSLLFSTDGEFVIFAPRRNDVVEVSRRAPDGRVFAVASGMLGDAVDAPALYRWKWRTDVSAVPVNTLRGVAISEITMGMTGHLAAVSTSGVAQQIHLIDPSMARVIWSSEPARQRYMRIALAPNGERVFAGAADGTVHVWDVHDGTPVHTLRHVAANPTGVAVSSDSNVVATSSGRTIYLWKSWSAPHADALDLIEAASSGVVMKEDMLERLEAAETPQHVRKAAVRIASIANPDPAELLRHAWQIALRAGAPIADYQSALRAAIAAGREAPWSEESIDAIALNQYRLGEHKAALGTLSDRDIERTLVRRPLLAMIYQGLGETERAKTTLGVAGAVLKGAATQDVQHLVEEATATISTSR